MALIGPPVGQLSAIVFSETDRFSLFFTERVQTVRVQT